MICQLSGRPALPHSCKMKMNINIEQPTNAFIPTKFDALSWWNVFMKTENSQVPFGAIMCIFD